MGQGSLRSIFLPAFLLSRRRSPGLWTANRQPFCLSFFRCIFYSIFPPFFRLRKCLLFRLFPEFSKDRLRSHSLCSNPMNLQYHRHLSRPTARYGVFSKMLSSPVPCSALRPQRPVRALSKNGSAGARRRTSAPGI